MRYDHKKLSADEYLEWLNTFLSILNDFTDLAEDQNTSPGTKATMISFLRVAEHVFNHFINHRSTYEYMIGSKTAGKSISAGKGLSRITSNDLKIERDKVADKIAGIIESDPKIRKRFKKFCDNLKEPRALGCCL